MINEKIVIFKYFGTYAITTKSNYDSQISNGNLITKFHDAPCKQEVIDIIVNWGIAEIDDIVDMTGE